MPRGATLLRVTALALAAFCHPAGAVDTAPPVPVAAPLTPIADFFDTPAFGEAQLSPDGAFLAARVGGQGQRERLAVVDLRDNSAKVVAQFPEVDIGDFQWISDNRLLFDTTDQRVGDGDVRYGPGLYAVNRDGTAFRQLARRSWETFFKAPNAGPILPWHTFMLAQPGAQDSAIIHVSNPNIEAAGQVNHVGLLRLNTLNGKASEIAGPGNTRDWLLDHKGQPRIVTTFRDGVSTTQYREGDGDTWRPLLSFDTFTGLGVGVGFTPLAFGPDGTLYVTSRDGSDRTTLRTFDLATNKLSAKPLVALDGYDFRGQLVMNQGKLLGLRYLADGEGMLWFDPAMKAMQAAIDARLPYTVNLVSLPVRPRTAWVLVESYSDTQPRIYFVYNTETKVLSRVGDQHAAIKASQMGNQAQVHYKARDGLDIPALLTLPNGKSKNLPLVVLVHGGPHVRGATWGWKAQSQFLASRGYAVLEPEYRGSTGFGAIHFRAGWKQWGLKMQDDIADGARWAIAQGIVDPKRICIAGASYGGYATLMGLVNDPDLFKCGIDWVGVTDIKLMYTGHWLFTSDLPQEFKQYGMPELIGDPVKDADQLKATSPLAQAARIRQPLLLAYGGADQRVPLIHGSKFRDAVKATNKDVEWIEYEKEGHGWALPENRIDFWSRVEKFLQRHIGAQP